MFSPIQPIQETSNYDDAPRLGRHHSQAFQQQTDCEHGSPSAGIYHQTIDPSLLLNHPSPLEAPQHDGCAARSMSSVNHVGLDNDWIYDSLYTQLTTQAVPSTTYTLQRAGGTQGVTDQPGLSEPPRAAKKPFTAEEDELLVKLKEEDCLTWKKIAESFPGRTPGTVQVRYCTKLKAGKKEWDDDADRQLLAAVHYYEEQKWSFVSQILGAGFTARDCKSRAEVLLEK